MNQVSSKAPWGAPLVIMTSLCSLMLLSVSVMGVTILLGNRSFFHSFGMSTSPPPWVGWLTVLAPLLGTLISAAFMVRGYVVTDALLIIKRLGWGTRLDLSRLTAVEVDPHALEGSMRLFGNGGFFSFSGWYRNKKLGVYRLFATDSKRAVVLRFSDKAVVVTPEDPQKFAADIASKISHGT